MKEIITIVGSSNTDLVVRATDFPRPGETIMGKQFNSFAGGKGANQAVASSRLGGNVMFIARVGNDSFGTEMLKGFQRNNIASEFVFTDTEEPSGIALIIVDDNGQNTIIVSAGANNRLSPDDIIHSSKAIEKASIVLMQLEIPIETVKKVLKTASIFDKKVILNPAPAMLLDDEMYKDIYLITPNETEASFLTGVFVNNEKTAELAADVLLKRGVKNVIITLGEKGAYFKNATESFLVSANKVKVIDTTAAGDIFNGAIAVALTEGKNWKNSIHFACKAAAIGVGRVGAQTSAPYRYEIIEQ